MRNVTLFLVLLTTTLAAGCITLFCLSPLIVSAIFKPNLELKNGSEAWGKFKENPSLTVDQFFFFNITLQANNATNGTSKPVLQEIGPYSFTIKTLHDVLSVSDDESRLTYSTRKVYEYVPQKRDNSSKYPVPDLYNDLVTTVNLPLIVAEMMAEDIKLHPEKYGIHKLELPVILKGLKTILEKEERFITRPASQLLFGGYKVEFVERLRSLARVLHITFPQLPLPDDMFGFMLLANNSHPIGIFNETRRTGVDEMDDEFRLTAVNGREDYGVWPGGPESKCNQVNGTLDGIHLPANIDRDDPISVMDWTVCRRFKLHFEKVWYLNRVETFKYVMVPEELDSPLVRNQTKCYCTRTDPIGRRLCQMHGLQDISSCPTSLGAPLLLSRPFFVGASPQLGQQFQWIPLKKGVLNNETYQSFIAFEPRTGAVIRAQSRMQINVMVGGGTGDNGKVWPLFWVNRRGDLKGTERTKLRDNIELVIFVNNILFGWAIIFSLLAVASAIFFVVRFGCCPKAQRIGING